MIVCGRGSASKQQLGLEVQNALSFPFPFFLRVPGWVVMG